MSGIRTGSNALAVDRINFTVAMKCVYCGADATYIERGFSVCESCITPNAHRDQEIEKRNATQKG